MPVVTRSQAKSNSKAEAEANRANTDVSTPKTKPKPNVVKEVPMYIWFGDMLRTYMAELNRVPQYEGRVNDKIRIITEMFYMINEHYENVSYHKYYSKLTKKIYIKARELRLEIALKYLSAPNANLALDELSKTINMTCKLLYENEELYENGEDENEVDKSSNDEDEDYVPNSEEDELLVQQDLEDDADQDYEEEYEEEENYIVKKPMNTHIRFEE